MKEYIEEIPRERLLTKEAAMSELNSFVIRLFRTLGYEMELAFRDDHTTGKRTVRARWREIEHEKPITNADRIRAMSDEELAAEVLSRVCPPERPGCGKFNNTSCYVCWLNWLQSPVKED